jgi:hypothetical protein
MNMIFSSRFLALVSIAVSGSFVTGAFTTTTQPAKSTAFLTRPAKRAVVLFLSDKPVEDKEEEETEGGLDLDLGEMFDMFEAADKDQSFDDAVKKIKGDK